MIKYIKIKKIIFRTILLVTGIITLFVFIILSPYLWKHFITYPSLENQKDEILNSYKQPEKFISLNEYKGVFHMHSYWSHDSRGTLEEILPAAKKAGFSFLFFSDHARSKQDTFPRSISGVYEGILFEPGTESSSGLMISPLDTTILDWTKDQDSLINEIVLNNGLVIYVHTEREHNWNNPDFQAMEIYNIHTDYLDKNDGLFSIIINLLINGSKYHHWVIREIYDEQTDILLNWDNLNKNRRITGVAAVDAHNNQSIRAKYLPDEKIEWVGPNAKTMSIDEPGILENILLDDSNKNGWAVKWEVDPYFISFNHVANHVFSDSLSSLSIKNNLVKGHAFISFQSLAKADGFQFFTVDKNNIVNAILGDSIKVENASKLKAVSPYPVKFELIKDGKILISTENEYLFEYGNTITKGNYRIVAKLNFNDQWVSWVFTNPIYIY
ncbi:MAG: hypothetical protein H6612_14835 [Ignavibacteriales bacterium]|nr:hypothetical protein [Ignavibacteriales bacterium]